MKQTIFRLILILSIVDLQVRCFSQTDYEKLTIAPPNTASFSKYGQIPVDLYTGVPDIKIPLYNMKEGNLTIPISISYHSSGIRVAEKATPVGLGWTLMAAGNITRQVRGLVDEDPEGFINYGGPIVNDLTQSYSPLMQKQHKLTDPLFGFDFTGGQRSNLKDIADGRCDGASDIYFFNAIESSGKFFFKNNGSILSMPFQNILIDRLNNGFKILDQDGRSSFFSKSDEMISDGGITFPYYMKNASTWSLDSIKDHIGNKILFKYYSNYSQYYEHHSDGRKSNTDLNIYSNYVYVNSWASYVDTIIGAESKVIFHYSKNRIDIPGELTLDSIVVLNMNNKIVNRVLFYHSYFIGTNNESLPFTDPNSHFRLKLDSLNILGETYIFNYNEIKLPSRHSKSQDAWGFYNSADNENLIPNYFSYSPLVMHNGADRCPNPDFVQAGVLTDIKFPTGGETHFEYESNEVYAKQFNNLPALVPYIFDTMMSGYYDVRDTHFLEIPFSIKYGDLNTNIYVDVINGGDEFIVVELLNESGNVLSTLLPFIHYDKSFFPGEYIIRVRGLVSYSVYTQVTLIRKTPVNEIDVKNDPYVNKIVGGLRIKSITDYAKHNVISSKINYKYVTETNSEKCSGKIFKFPIFHKWRAPYFIVHSIQNNCIISPGDCSIQGFDTIIDFYSYNLTSVNFNTETLVEYSSVTKEIGVNAEGGKIVYNFTTSETDPDFKFKEEFDYDASPYTSVAWNRGLLLSEKMYKIVNNNFIITKEIDNYYYKNTAMNDPIRFSMGIVTRKAQLYNYDCTMLWQQCMVDPTNCSGCVAFWRPYLTLSGWSSIDSTISLEYLNEGVLKTVTSYVYSSPNYFPDLLLTEKIILTSTNDKIIEKYLYPSHYNNLNIGNDFGVVNLRNKHRVNSIVEKSKYIQKNQSVNSQLIESTLIKYDETLGLPKIIYKTENTGLVSDYIPSHSESGNLSFDASLLKPFYYFDKYDIKGNLLQSHKLNEPYTSYHFGYNNSYPTTVINNSTYEECDFMGFENDEAPGWEICQSWSFYTGNNELIKTGKKSIFVQNGYGPSKYFNVGVNANSHCGYKASVWVKGDPSSYIHIQVNDDYSLSKRVSNTGGSISSWQLLEVDLPNALFTSQVNENFRIKVYLGTSGLAYFDDLRFYPTDAQMTTYTYEPFVGVTSVSDANNKATTYEYDGFGRLIVVRDYLGNILKKNDYHYLGNNQ